MYQCSTHRSYAQISRQFYTPVLKLQIPVSSTDCESEPSAKTPTKPHDVSSDSTVAGSGGGSTVNGLEDVFMNQATSHQQLQSANNSNASSLGGGGGGGGGVGGLSVNPIDKLYSMQDSYFDAVH